MTLNILFFTITIKARKKTTKEYLEEERVRKLYESHTDRIFMHRGF